MSRKMLVIVLLLVIYTVGVISGFFVGGYLAMRKGFFPHMRFHGPPSTEHVVAMLSDKLSLTQEQKQKISIVLENNKAAMDKYRVEFDSGMKKTFDAMNVDIRTVLSEKQKTIFDRFVSERSEGREPHGDGFLKRKMP